jgi:hypothetical protein
LVWVPRLGCGRRDLTGREFGEWTVLAFSHVSETGKSYFFCRCSCGKEKLVEGYTLTGGRSRSCRRCSAVKVANKVNRTHGMSRTKVYRTWQSIKTRCYNSKSEKCFKYHGGVGVRVCQAWLDSFESFYEYMGEPPTPLHTIDRIDPFGHYEPGNVRWATQSEQMQNTRRSMLAAAPEKRSNLRKMMGELCPEGK